MESLCFAWGEIVAGEERFSAVLFRGFYSLGFLAAVGRSGAVGEEGSTEQGSSGLSLVGPSGTQVFSPTALSVSTPV